ncbi:MAG TPA: type II toxin-antitoxin system VapB family antitoxin [Rhodanobacteraceae bacterium]|nr:type II toxin-antitoxin system VapB family antitoxin [Rhodanobacteraceae bacterium]HET8554050.1 type II toxin-antitoxin system VapB family antitoxin [Rhodanobacteraceae bacterium]
MRTNIVIDDALMTEAMKASGYTTKKKAVEEGLRLLLQRSQQRHIRSLRGKVRWEGDLNAMRETK